jgi:hypothetical protein
MKPNNSSEGRNIKDCAFCWQEKAALDKIRQSGDSASALLVYLVLTEIASDHGAETFQAALSFIAGKAMLSRRTVSKLIEPLELFGLIAVKRSKVPGSKLNAPHTYTLLKVGKLIPYGIREASKVAQNRRKKEKNTLSSLRSERTRSVAGAHFLSNGLNSLTEEERRIVDDYNAIFVPLGWVKVNKATDELQKVLQIHDAAEWSELFRDVANGPRDEWPNRQTLVRLGWHNY